jgi:uncharacterized MnhB-related membrane protein
MKVNLGGKWAGRKKIGRKKVGPKPISRDAARVAVLDAVLLGVACLVSYWVETHLLSHVGSVSRPDDLLGGMWATIATIFVFRDSYQRSVAAAASRVSATLVVTLLGRPDDAITCAITTTVILVVVAVSPAHAREQPLLRFLDTVAGVAVGIGAAWFGLRVVHPRGQAGPRQGRR